MNVYIALNTYNFTSIFEILETEGDDEENNYPYQESNT
jgi:hypothetical protein